MSEPEQRSHYQSAADAKAKERPSLTEAEAALRVRIEAAHHAVQTGVAMEMQHRETKAHEPKFLRTGVNMAMVDIAAIAQLLIDKGVISQRDYLEALAAGAEAEVKRHEVRLSDHLGVPVTLA